MPFSAKTLLITGAGASREIGFPMGFELKEQIRSCTKVKWNGVEFTGDREFCSLIDHYTRTHGGFVQPVLDACQHIHENVVLSGSIDEFLSSHQDDEIVVFCAKLAIALQIAKAERESHLNPNTASATHTDFVYLKDTYLPRLWARLQNGEPIANWIKFFDNLRIVTFNYDRVLEQFFSLAIQRFCRVEKSDATEFVSKLPIVHVYGSLGDLRTRGSYCQFAPDKNSVFDASQRILTFSETVADKVREQISAHASWADRIIFLGFSYANVNVNLLPDQPNRNNEVVGTAFGMSGPNREFATGRLNLKLDNLKRTILAPCECAQLFDEYQLWLQ